MNRSSFVSKLFTPVITLLVLAYFGYQIYGYVSDPFSTTLAYTCLLYTSDAADE